MGADHQVSLGSEPRRQEQGQQGQELGSGHLKVDKVALLSLLNYLLAHNH